MFIIRYCSKRRQPSEGKCLHFDHLYESACVDFSSAVGGRRTTRCAQNHTEADKIFMRRKRKENREFPSHRLQFQTRVDRWVLITALCVVEWNAQHNWLVCITVGGEFSRTFTISCSLSEFHNFRLELDIVKIACLVDIPSISNHCSSAIRPDNHVCQRRSLVFPESFLFHLVFSKIFFWLIHYFCTFIFLFFVIILSSDSSRGDAQFLSKYELLTIVSEIYILSKWINEWNWVFFESRDSYNKFNKNIFWWKISTAS